MALSQELLAWSLYGQDDALDAGQLLWLESTDYPVDPRCNGYIILADAMNARYTQRGDLFFINRDDNVSCTVDIYLP
jgi:hypothetical protein